MPLVEVNSIWNAAEQLALVQSPLWQRPYNQSARARHILTARPGGDGKIDGNDLVPFTAATFNGSTTLQRALNLPSSINRTDLIDWLRGQEVDGFRSRTAEFTDLNDGPEVWRLGDIIHSTPTAVGPPSQDYDIMLGDTTYATFKHQYKDRRTVIYAGANDGMLHAFNGGFWDSEAKAFLRVPDGSTLRNAPLGNEMWAYVPFNLMPHLKWLVEEEYPHVYYVDGNPKAFDARVFDATDPDHPGGWGTVLAVPFRFGGGAYWVDLNGVAGDGPNGSDEEWRMRSTLVLFDITNPEEPPQLMAELSDADFADFFYTTNNPTLVKAIAPSSQDGWDQPAVNEWKLVFGVGLTARPAQREMVQPGLFIGLGLAEFRWRGSDHACHRITEFHR